MRWKRATVALVLAPTLLALLLRFYDLSGKPLWLDEVITYKRGLLPIAELAHDSLINRHFPTYFVIARLFDPPLIDEWLLRLPSVICGSLAVLLVTLIAIEIHSWRAGLLAGLLMALSPIEVQFSQEARPYALVSCLVMLALWGLVRIAKLATSTQPSARTDKLTAWTAYLVGTIAALNVLLVTAFWLLASNLAFAVIARTRPDRPRLVRQWLAVQFVIVLAWLPGLLSLYLAIGDDPLRGYRWIPQTTWSHVETVLSTGYLFRAAGITTFAYLPGHVFGLGVVAVVAALLGAWRLRSDPKLLASLGFSAIMMPVAMAIISAYHPVWIPRYLLWGTGAFYVLAAVGIAALPRRLVPVAGAAFAIAGLVNLAPYYRSETKPRWDLAAAYLAQHMAPDDSIVAGGAAAKYILDAYAKRYRIARPVLNDGDSARVAPGFIGDGRIWLVIGRTGQTAIPSEQSYLAKWSALGAPAATLRFGRQVVAWRFDPPRAADR